MDMTIIIPLLSGFLSGVVGVLLTYYLTTRGEHDVFMRSKTEELYVAVEVFDRAVAGHFLPGYTLLKGQMSWNDFNDMTIKNYSDSDRDASIRVQMLIDIYFSGVQQKFIAYIGQRDTLNKILSRHKKAYKAGEHDESLLPEFHSAMKELDRRSKSLKSEVIAEARRCANVKQANSPIEM